MRVPLHASEQPVVRFGRAGLFDRVLGHARTPLYRLYFHQRLPSPQAGLQLQWGLPVRDLLRRNFKEMVGRSIPLQVEANGRSPDRGHPIENLDRLAPQTAQLNGAGRRGQRRELKRNQLEWLN